MTALRIESAGWSKAAVFLCTYLALQVGDLSGKLGLQSIREQVVNWT